MLRSKSFDNSQPLLYLVATPIGNLQEISQRALEVFKGMDIIAAEDTRNTFSLLAKYGIKKELFSLREHNEIEASNYLIKLLKEGKKVAYVSDAGYPGISDPGYLLVKATIKEGISISTVSGSSAFINALVASGLPTNHFYFYGFLPKKGNEAESELNKLKEREETLIFYESPHHIKETMELLIKVFENRRVVIARELTKINEEYIRGTLDEFKDFDFSTLKGEMVVILEGNQSVNASLSDEDIKEKLEYYLSLGISKKTAVEIAEHELELPKNRIYKIAQKM